MNDIFTTGNGSIELRWTQALCGRLSTYTLCFSNGMSPFFSVDNRDEMEESVRGAPMLVDFIKCLKSSHGGGDMIARERG